MLELKPSVYCPKSTVVWTEVTGASGLSSRPLKKWGGGGGGGAGRGWLGGEVDTMYLQM